MRAALPRERCSAIREHLRLPLPEVNRRIAGWKVDFLWRKEGVVVEVDGDGNHHTPAQVDGTAARTWRCVPPAYS